MLCRLVFVLSLICACGIALGQGQDSLKIGDGDRSAIVETEHEDGIVEFRRKFLIRFLCNYNFVSFWSSEFDGGALKSNRPVDVGLGLGYGDFYWDFIYALPFTSNNKSSKSISFETGFDFFPGNWWVKGVYRSYSGFSTDVGDSSLYVDLWERDVYVSALWLGTSNGEFSPRAAFFLDRRQRHSAGSLILGGRIQGTKTKDKDEFFPYYQEPKEIFSSWVDMGYTYTWVFDNKVFLNLWGVAGVAVGGDTEEDDYMLLPEIIAKFAFGYIGEIWSWNNVLETEYMPVIFDSHWEQKLVCAYKILIVRRF